MRARIAVTAGAIVGLGALVALGLIVKDRRNQVVWDHFDVVKPGLLYRSGQLTSDQLEAAIRKYGLKTIVNFQVPGPNVSAERELAKRLNVGFLNLPMPGDGFGREEQFRQVLKAIDDPDRRPVLVHCARGTCRTGAAVALYRYERDGWTPGDVADEMRRQTYREEFLPGYIYSMVRRRPFDVLNPGLPTVDDRPALPSISDSTSWELPYVR